MKIIFAGTGSAFTVGTDNYHSNFIIESPNQRRLMVDCGTDARLSLYEIGLTSKNINDVYVSHLHSDHAGGLEWLGFTTYFDKTCAKPKLNIHKNLAKDLWRNSLSGPMRSLPKSKINLETYFNVNIIDTHFRWEGIEFKLVPVEHVMKNNKEFAPCFGLLFTINNFTIFHTSDTRFTPTKLQPFYEQADLIFHDCEITEYRTGVHANYEDLLKLDRSIKEKMWLIHYNPLPLPEAKKEGFLGFVMPKQEFIFN